MPRMGGFGKGDHAGARLQVLPQERARMRECAAARFEPRVPKRPRMNHVRPDFERHRVVGLAGRGGEADSIVEQGLGRTNLDQRRRQSPEIGV